MSEVQPYEAQGWAPTLDEAGSQALRDLMTAVNGFYYPGDRASALYNAVAWLQHNPAACAALRLVAKPETAA